MLEISEVRIGIERGLHSLPHQMCREYLTPGSRERLPDVAVFLSKRPSPNPVLHFRLQCPYQLCGGPSPSQRYEIRARGCRNVVQNEGSCSTVIPERVLMVDTNAPVLPEPVFSCGCGSVAPFLAVI